MISTDLKRKASELARLEEISLGEFTRRALETAVKQTRKGHGQTDPLLSDRAKFRGKTPRNLSEHHDSYLSSGK